MSWLSIDYILHIIGKAHNFASDGGGGQIDGRMSLGGGKFQARRRVICWLCTLSVCHHVHHGTRNLFLSKGFDLTIGKGGVSNGRRSFQRQFEP